MKEAPRTITAAHVKAPLDRRCDDFTSSVREVLIACARKTAALLGGQWDIANFVSGKMLRTRFAARVSASLGGLAEPGGLVNVCAATELAHTASLCHDDVIDNALIRRACPALWKVTSPSGAVLIGDLVLCEAMELLMEAEGGRYLSRFIRKLREVCAAEAEHELLLRGRELDASTCLRIARGKTGPLFAFVGGASGGGDPDLSSGLEEAGYLIGTAYQLRDDLLDCSGDETAAEKTLGTDVSRRKFTLAQDAEHGEERVRDRIAELLRAAVEGLAPWPEARAGVERFIGLDLGSLGPCQLEGGYCWSKCGSTSLTTGGVP